MPTMAVGALYDGNSLSASYKYDVDETIRIQEGNGNEMARLYFECDKETGIGRTHYWHIDEVMPQMDQVDGAFLSTDLSIKVDNINYWAPGDVVQFDNNETAVIDSVNTATSYITFTERSHGATAAASISDNAQILNLGSAQEEGASAREPRTTVPSEKSNNMQIFSAEVSFTGTELAVNKAKGIHGGDKVKHERRKKFLEVQRKIDSALLWGEKGTAPRTLGGLNEFIPSGQRDSTSALTLAALDSFLETKGMRYSSEGGMKNKTLLCSWQVSRIINVHAQTNIRTKSGDSKFGLRTKTYESPFGEIDILPHTNFQKTEHKKYGFVVDPNDLKRVVLPDRELALYVDVDSKRLDLKMDVYLGEMTAKWAHPNWLAALTGVATAA